MRCDTRTRVQDTKANRVSARVFQTSATSIRDRTEARCIADGNHKEQSRRSTKPCQDEHKKVIGFDQEQLERSSEKLGDLAG